MTTSPRRIQYSALLAICALLNGSHRLSAQENDPVNYLPPGANAIVVVDVQSLLASEYAIREGWEDKQNAEYGTRPVLLPPEAERVVIGAQLDTAGDLGVAWEVAALQLNRDFTLEEISLPEGGYIDTIGDVSAVWTPSNAYIVDLEGTDLGIMYPADRQAVSRWMSFVGANPTGALSDYLTEAAAMATHETQIVMAIDLQDALTPHRVREGLMRSATFMMNDHRIDRLVPLVTGARGVTMTVSVGREIRGQLRFDFSDDASIFFSQAKDFALEVLNNHDALLPDIEHWSARNVENSLILEGPLSESGLRRLATLLDVPTTKFSDLAETEPAEEGTLEGTNAYTAASLGYYRSVKALVDDLRETLDDTRDNHALWFERFARRIDALPILNVDDMLLDWGSMVAETFRSMSLETRTANVNAGVRVMEEAQSGYYNTYDNYGYATGGYYDATHDRYTIRAQERAEANKMKFATWNELENSMADIRRDMTQKYGIEF